MIRLGHEKPRCEEEAILDRSGGEGDCCLCCLGESRLLSFGIFAFWHDGQSPLVLTMRRGVGVILGGDWFEVAVGDVEGERCLSRYALEGTRSWSDSSKLR